MVVGQAAGGKPQNVYLNCSCHHFCALKYFFFCIFLPFLWTPAGKHFCALKYFFHFVFCLCFSFFKPLQ